MFSIRREVSFQEMQKCLDFYLRSVARLDEKCHFKKCRNAEMQNLRSAINRESEKCLDYLRNACRVEKSRSVQEIEKCRFEIQKCSGNREELLSLQGHRMKTRNACLETRGVEMKGRSI